MGQRIWLQPFLSFFTDTPPAYLPHRGSRTKYAKQYITLWCNHTFTDFGFFLLLALYKIASYKISWLSVHRKLSIGFNYFANIKINTINGNIFDCVGLEASFFHIFKRLQIWIFDISRSWEKSLARRAKNNPTRVLVFLLRYGTLKTPFYNLNRLRGSSEQIIKSESLIRTDVCRQAKIIP